VAPGVAYAGSLERVGPEPWSEAFAEKGVVFRELSSGRTRLHPVHGRPVVALAPIAWDPERPERMNERIREVSEEVPGGLEGKIVRLRLTGVGPDQLRAVDGELLASLRARAFYLAVEVEDPGAAEGADGPATGSGDLLDRVLRRVEGAGGDDGEPLREVARRFLHDDGPSRPEGRGA